MSYVRDDPESGACIRDAALRYTAQGWSVIPVPYRSKNPGIKRWEQLRLAKDDLLQYFNGTPQNIGILLGEPSQWVIDIDLDHPLALELASQFLPSTPAIFGRSGNPRSHWIYRATGPVATKRYKSKSAGTIVELRSTGSQTVFPPSTHECGEPIYWEDEAVEPAIVDPDELFDCVKRLAEEVTIRLGEKQPTLARKRTAVARSVAEASPDHTGPDHRVARCRRAISRCQLGDSNDGSHRLFSTACRVVEFDLDDAAALSVIRDHAREKPFPRDWTDEEILRRIRDAEKRCDRGSALRVDAEGNVPLGERDPATGRLVLSPKRTLPTADAYVREFHTHPGGRTLQSYAGPIWEWQQNRYVELEDQAAMKQLQAWLHAALRYMPNRNEGLELVPFESNPTTVKWALETIRNFVHIPVSLTPPIWLNEDPANPPPLELLACKSVLLHLPSGRSLSPSPSFFTTTALDFDPDPNAPEPMLWHAFLHQLFDGDLESLELLQDWFGYLLTPDTSLQKMLLLVGPRRSGKGTLARILNHLIGVGNVCGPTTSSLAGPFGLQPLIGKTLAVVSDARFSGQNMPTVVERLLCVTGEDAVSIDRKFLGSLTMKLPTRFMFLSNEIPKFTDASGALVGRFVILRLTQSFYGREDPTLTNKLLNELPGILNWAIEGWHRVRERGHFVMPQSAEDSVRDMEDLASPVGAFVREECVVGPGHRVDVNDLYEAWKRWCEQEGRTLVSTKQSFGRDLSAAVGVERRRSTVSPFYEGITLRK